jgi:hypothetical protein
MYKRELSFWERFFGVGPNHNAAEQARETSRAVQF